MKISDEQLMAYVDDELDAPARARVEAALAADPLLAKRVEEQHQLRSKLRAAFDDVLNEPVPDRLLAAARTAPAGSSVADFAKARAQKAARPERATRRFTAPVWAAIAASMVIGVLVAFALRSPVSPFSLVDGTLVAQGSVEEALTHQLALEQAPDAPVQVGLTFRDESGNLCRTFLVRDGDGMAGLACHENGAWAMQVLARYSPAAANGGYRPAAGDLPPSVLNVVEDRIVGEPLDAQAEMAARRSGWRNKK